VNGVRVADRLAVRELAESYAAAADRRDRELFAGLWAPDGVLRVEWPDGGPETVLRGPKRCAAVIDGLTRYQRTLHVVANQLCEPGENGELLGEVYCEAHHLDASVDRVLYIRYVDRYRECGREWRFARRTAHVLWAERRPVGKATRPR
jgi:SnoaL-like domain